MKPTNETDVTDSPEDIARGSLQQHGSADPTCDVAYQSFVESMVKHCHCRANNCPCDGVLAGGPCDMVQEESPERTYDEDE